ncbi:putative alpha-tocopherol transfer protein-like [Apostichopus japonicus]|uniref:Putative alpha-tocopherol transfer protein-like n=1 Tax=Stichopus japonicus TaxID=307972 RepID=A0A2G8LD05_STIJA|nr:putative alpha-tocopherol transfer protein-like [Apostichopus japonicus]
MGYCNTREQLLPTHAPPPPSLSRCSNCIPVRISGIHFVNEPVLFDGAFTIMKPFMNDKMRQRVKMHGSNYSALHKYVSPKILRGSGAAPWATMTIRRGKKNF